MEVEETEKEFWKRFSASFPSSLPPSSPSFKKGEELKFSGFGGERESVGISAVTPQTYRKMEIFVKGGWGGQDERRRENE